MVADLEDDEVVLVARGDGARAAGGWGEGSWRGGTDLGTGGAWQQRRATGVIVSSVERRRPLLGPATVSSEYTVWRSYLGHTLLVMRALTCV
jgi:hypothetical protein